MKDRASRYPGRVKMVPVTGQENTYDMTRADQPTQTGDPLNKNTLLKDSTAALFGLDDTALPDDVFVATKAMFDSRVRIASGSYVGTGVYGENNPCELTFPFAPKMVLVFRKAGMGLMTGGDSDGSAESASHAMIAAYPAASTGVIGHDGSYAGLVENILTFTGKTMRWYSSGLRSGPGSQLNESGVEYQYYAIGGGDDGAGDPLSAFEYQNPPMHVGVEYRTTERWNGKPVYVQKRPSVSLASAGSVVYIEGLPGNIDEVIDSQTLIKTSWGAVAINTYPNDAANRCTTMVQVSADHYAWLSIKCLEDCSDFTATWTAKYTKTTD